ncbi:MAG: hypothetical protein Q9M25_10005 [Mariprofundaceae bacterium]|nr:hypothetical protein [Mariprofundaceae bacterium]
MRIHPLGRFCFAIFLFVAVLMVNKLWSGVVLLLLAVLLVRLFSASWMPLWRALRLLLWLLIPIILLHLMFTPGRLLWPDSMLPFSREGMDQGLWLAFRLCALFFAAMALSRSLNNEEWTYYSVRLPLIGKQVLPYIQLAAPMRQMVGDCLKHRKIRPLKHLPTMLVALFEAVWRGAEVQADKVWDQWGLMPQHVVPRSGVFSAVLLALCGIGLLFVSGVV